MGVRIDVLMSLLTTFANSESVKTDTYVSDYN